MIVVVVVLVVVAIAGVTVLVSYNRFVSQQQFIDNAWANVESELRRRYDLVPNLVNTVKGYAAHERTVLEEVTEARRRCVDSNGPADEQAGDENMLVGALRQLMALAEAYPDLQAAEGFRELQAELVSTENRIQASRRFFNNNVRDYNTRAQSVPSNLVAGLFGFAPRPYFEIDAVATTVPTASFSDDGSGSAAAPTSDTVPDGGA